MSLSFSAAKVVQMRAETKLVWLCRVQPTFAKFFAKLQIFSDIAVNLGKNIKKVLYLLTDPTVKK